MNLPNWFDCMMHRRRFAYVRKAIVFLVLGNLLVNVLMDYSNKTRQDLYTTTLQPPVNTQPPHAKPTHLSTAGGFQRRYVSSPHRGYKRAGGLLPVDTADFLQSESMWKYLNDTCLHDQEGRFAEWQYRVPYVILLGAMKVRVFN
jgi:hypothetical protein